MGRAGLDDAAVVHDRDLVGQGAHHPQVVGDEEVGHVVAALQVAQQFDDLGLDGHVQGAGRFVEHQEAGF